MPPPPSAPPGDASSATSGADVWGSDSSGRAGFGNRLGGYLLDGLLYGIAMAVPIIIGVVMIVAAFADCVTVFDDVICPDGAPSAGLLGGGIAVVVLGFLFVVVIYLRALGRTGQTWGRRIVGNKVVRVDNGDVPGIGRALGRELFGWIISANILYLGYLWMIWDKDRQTWHDKVAGTIVVRTRCPHHHTRRGTGDHRRYSLHRDRRSASAHRPRWRALCTRPPRRHRGAHPTR